MGIKESILKGSRLAIIIATVVIVLAVVFIVYQIRSTHTPAPESQAYYTDDEGKSWFADTVGKVVPFDHDGKQAFGCVVIDGSHGKRIAYMQKLNDQARSAEMQVADANGVPSKPIANVNIPACTLIKRPGDTAWVSIISPAAAQVQSAMSEGTVVEP